MGTSKCVYCGKEKDDFRGIFLIKNDGTVNYYCSSKCRKNNFKLKRDKRKLKWTSAFVESRDKKHKHAAHGQSHEAKKA